MNKEEIDNLENYLKNILPYELFNDYSYNVDE